LWSPPLASSLKSTVGHGRSTWDRRNLRTHLRSRNAIWEKQERFCLPSFADCAHERLVAAYCMRAGLSLGRKCQTAALSTHH
jgi:hypothetical protein